MFCCQVKLELEKQADAAGVKGCDTRFFCSVDVSLPGRGKLHRHTTKDSMDLLSASSRVTHISLRPHTRSLWLVWQQQWLIVETPKKTKCVFSEKQALAATLIITDLSVARVVVKAGDFILLYKNCRCHLNSAYHQLWCPSMFTFEHGPYDKLWGKFFIMRAPLVKSFVSDL